MLFIIDTNTLVSAILKPISTPAFAVLKAQTRGQLLFSTETKSEFIEVIGRSKFDQYLPASERLQKCDELLKHARIELNVNIADKPFCIDPNDVKFLELAEVVKVDCIISGDGHLTDLDPFKGIPILTPAGFIEWIKE